MPRIEEEINAIQNAVYGEEVRGSIVNALQKMNNNIDSSSQVALRNSIAPVWSVKAWPKGAYAWYPTTDGTLYKSNREIASTYSTPPSSSSYWDEVTLADGLYADVDNIVKVQNSQPTEPINKIWIKDRDSEVSVPSEEEFAKATAKAYSTTAKYVTGDYCVYEGLLYCCTTDITTGEAWDASHWTTASLGHTLSNLNYNAEVVNFIEGYYINISSNTTINLTPNSNSGYAYAIIDCAPGTMFYLSGVGGSGARLYCFIDKDNKVLERAASNADELSGKIIKAPVNTKKVVFNVIKQHSYCVYRHEFIVQSPDYDRIASIPLIRTETEYEAEERELFPQASVCFAYGYYGILYNNASHSNNGILVVFKPHDRVVVTQCNMTDIYHANSACIVGTEMYVALAEITAEEKHVNVYDVSGILTAIANSTITTATIYCNKIRSIKIKKQGDIEIQSIKSITYDKVRDLIYLSDVDSDTWRVWSTPAPLNENSNLTKMFNLPNVFPANTCTDYGGVVFYNDNKFFVVGTSPSWVNVLSYSGKAIGSFSTPSLEEAESMVYDEYIGNYILFTIRYGYSARYARAYAFSLNRCNTNFNLHRAFFDYIEINTNSKSIAPLRIPSSKYATLEEAMLDYPDAYYYKLTSDSVCPALSFRNKEADIRRGTYNGVRLSNCEMIFRNCTFMAPDGSVAHVGTSCVMLYNSTVTFINCTFVPRTEGASYVAMSGSGGQVLFDNCTGVTPDNISFTGNVMFHTSNPESTFVVGVDDVKEELFTVTGNSSIHMTSGAYINTTEPVNITTPVSNLQWKYAVIPCQAGDSFTVEGEGASIARLWNFLDSSLAILVNAGSSDSGSFYITAPEGTAYLVINIKGSGYAYKGRLLVDEVNNGFTSIEYATGLTEIEFTNTCYISTTDTLNNTKVPNKQYKCAEVSCSDGDVFTLFGTGGTAQSLSLWAFYDSNNALIARSGANVALSNAVLRAPYNASKLIINVRTSISDDKCYKGLHPTVEDIQSVVPYYYETYLENKIDEINALTDESPLTGDSFVFITDYHRQVNTKNSAALIKRILERTGTNFVVFGGDAQDYEHTFSEAMEVNKGFKDDYKHVASNMYSIIGNHEFNSHYATDQDSSMVLSYNQVYGFFCKQRELTYGSVDAYGDYWIDNVAQKIRYFFIGCTSGVAITLEQQAWLFREFESVPAGYSIIVFSHLTFKHVPESTDKIYVAAGPAKIAQGMTKLNSRTTFTTNGVTYDYTNSQAEAVAIIGGHTHYDASTSYSGLCDSEGNPIIWQYVPIICTTTDALGRGKDNTGPVIARGACTTTEQAFDVVHLDLSNKRIIMKRIGAYRVSDGQTRTFTYGS